jgi:murein DD-endopeptidase MepM/ murein hydrolase activator NlpD
VTTTTIPFAGLLKLGSTGTQPVAVKRGLWHAGYRDGWEGLDGAAVAAAVLGPAAVQNLAAYQKYNDLTDDGVYGPATHRKLVGWFDAYAALLYVTSPPVYGATVQLPAVFTPTHQTEGLPGYPAIDVFAKPGTEALAPETGRVTRLSGHPPAEGGDPGGAYGWSVYLTCPHAVYFLTHFATRHVTVGELVQRGEKVGTVCDAAVAHMASSLSHIHVGKHLE